MKIYTATFLMFSLLQVLSSCSSRTDVEEGGQADVSVSTNETIELSKTQFQNMDMKFGKLETKTFHEVIKATGMFDVPPQNQASVSSYFGGTVKNIQLLPGQRVGKGQILFTLENPDFIQVQQDFLEAKGQLAYLESDYERQKNLVQDNVSSQKNYLKAEADYTVIRVKVESLRKKLLLMNINPNKLSLENIKTSINVSSPINGYVSQVDISRGAFLNASQSAITIIDTDHMHIELNIFEKDLSRVRKGQTIRFSIQEDKSKMYNAYVYLVNKTVDQKNRTIGIHGHLSDGNLSSMFTPGMYVEADIYSTSVEKVSLPEDALVEVEGKYYALVLLKASNDKYSLQKREVQSGESSNGYVEVLNQKDFDENTQFLIKGAFNLIAE